MRQDLVRDLGELALATRLRRLSERLLAGVDELYRELGQPFEGRWFGLVQALAREDGRGVVELAAEVGLSHTAVAQLLRELDAAGWTGRQPDPRDARRQRVRVTRAGRQRLTELAPVWEAVRRATAGLLAEEAPDLLVRLEALEERLERAPLADRMLQELGRPSRRRLRVVAYRPAYRRLFAELNLAWLNEHFTPDEQDLRLLADPAGRVLRRGGRILVALWEEQPVGVCALLRHGAGDYELAKLAVDPARRRRGAGEALVRAACAEARALGATRLWLLTHPRLVDAQRLYLKLGFQLAGTDDQAHARPSLRLERVLDPAEDFS
ncbi:MAG: helix-turn-helix domain-containing GNAT family N-acetyltransferase [Candidatus Delongbacteria bacterium]